MEDAQTRSECGVIVKRLPSCMAIFNPHVSVSFYPLLPCLLPLLMPNRNDEPCSYSSTRDDECLR